MRITLTILFVLLIAAYFYSYVDAGQKLSKREVYAVACRDYKENMPKKYKELSRREIWSTCTGEDKKDAPSYNTEKPNDWILHNNKNYSPIKAGTLSSLETE